MLKCELCGKKVTHKIAVIIAGTKEPIFYLKTCLKCKKWIVKNANKILTEYFAAIKGGQ